MTDTASHLLKRLEKRAKNGARGYPVGTRAFYGPDDHRASKMVAAIVEREGAEPSWMQKWHSDTGDVRGEPVMLGEVLTFFEEHRARSLVMPDRIIGCPHEEGVDYDGDICPHCPFWAVRDRWSGEVIQ
jgi:hypothetical protein